MPEPIDSIRAGTRYPLSAYAAGGRSDFTSGAPGSALWFAVQNGRVILHRSQGDTVVRHIQRALGVTPDGFWGARTNEALRKALLRNGYNADFVQDGTPSYKMLEAALAATYGSPYSQSLSAVEGTIVPRTARLPKWLRRAPNDGAYHGFAWHAEWPMASALPRPPARPPAPRAPVPLGRGRVVVSPPIDVGGNSAAGLFTISPAGENPPVPVAPLDSPGPLGPGDAPGDAALWIAGGTALAVLIAGYLAARGK